MEFKFVIQLDSPWSIRYNDITMQVFLNELYNLYPVMKIK